MTHYNLIITDQYGNTTTHYSEYYNNSVSTGDYVVNPHNQLEICKVNKIIHINSNSTIHATIESI